MCNLTNAIHTPCLHDGGLSIRSRCTKGLFSGRLTGCDDSITEGITYVPSLCAGCAYRSSVGLPVASITFRALDETVVNLTSVQLGQSKERVIAAEERKGADEDARFLMMQQVRRERHLTLIQTQFGGFEKVEILAFKSLKAPSKLILKLESILEVDEVGEIPKYVNEAEQEKESLSSSIKASSTRSSTSSTLYGSSSATTLQTAKTDRFEERYKGANEAENEPSLTPERSPASIDSVSSIVSFGFARAVEMQSVKAVEIEILRARITTQ